MEFDQICVYIDIDKIWVWIVKHQFSQIHNRVMPLDSYQNLVSAQYFENKLMEFDQILHMQ